MTTRETTRNRINRNLSALGTYHKSISLDDIFNIVKVHDGMPVQEDNTEWSGFLCGEQGNANIRCLFGETKPMWLNLSWYKMDTRNGGHRYEIVTYIS